MFEWLFLLAFWNRGADTYVKRQPVPVTAAVQTVSRETLQPAPRCQLVWLDIKSRTSLAVCD